MKKYFILALSFLLMLKFAAAQTVVVTGTVKSSDGDLLHLAFVQDKQSKSGVYTDSVGNFSLSVTSNTILRVTCLGYRDTVFKLNGNVTLTIIMRTAVTITASNNKQGDAGTQQLAQQQLSDRIMFNTPVAGSTNVAPYTREQPGGSTIPPAWYGGASPPPPPPVRVGGDGGPPVPLAPGAYGNPLNTAIATAMGTTPQAQTQNNAITQGDAIAVYSEKGETQGSRLLFKEWTHGYVIDSEDSLVQSPAFLLNYDKMGGNLLLTKDRVSVITIYNDKIKSFTLFDELNQPHMFAIVPDINKSHYTEVLSDGTNYKIYKSIKTTFVKANYSSDGVASTGNNYDEYHDDFDYYVLNVKTNQLQEISLKKKAIKQVFAADAEKLNKFMADNSGDIDEAYLGSLGDFLNK